MGALAELAMRNYFYALALAGLLGLLSQFFFPLALLSNALIALYVLSRRNAEWLLLWLGTSALVYSSSFVVTANPGFEIPVTLLLALPVLLCAKALALTESQSLSILLAVFCAVMLALSIQLVSGDAVQWWTDWLKRAVAGVNNARFEGFAPDKTLPLVNGLVAMLLVFFTVLTVFIARWMQAGLFNPGGFAEEFRHIKFPFSVVAVLAVILLVTGVVNENLFKDFLLIFSVPFFFQGMSVLHFTVDRMGRGQSLLWPPYLLLVFLPQYVIVGMACVGLADVFVNFRKPVRK
ncbi:MAG: hypothetical protein ACU84J_02450 [Gammaproteobacteria bacterium]